MTEKKITKKEVFEWLSNHSSSDDEVLEIMEACQMQGLVLTKEKSVFLATKNITDKLHLLDAADLEIKYYEAQKQNMINSWVASKPAFDCTDKKQKGGIGYVG